MQLGLWSHDHPTGRMMARVALVQLAARLPSIDETIAAVFACQPESADFVVADYRRSVTRSRQTPRCRLNLCDCHRPA